MCILESPKERKERKAEVLFKRRMTENARVMKFTDFKHRYKPRDACMLSCFHSYLAI